MASGSRLWGGLQGSGPRSGQQWLQLLCRRLGGKRGGQGVGEGRLERGSEDDSGGGVWGRENPAAKAAG